MASCLNKTPEKCLINGIVVYKGPFIFYETGGKNQICLKRGPGQKKSRKGRGERSDKNIRLKQEKRCLQIEEKLSCSIYNKYAKTVPG